MNSLLPNGNIRSTYPVGVDEIRSVGVREISPSDPAYEACTVFMLREEALKARSILAEYRKTHSAAS